MKNDPSTRYVKECALTELVELAPNEDVIRFLSEHKPFCHPDTGQALIESAEKCGDWVAYSPSFRQCRYVALITRRRVFAIGIGQHSVCYRLSEDAIAIALQSGGIAAGQVGLDWVRFELFQPNRPAPDLPFWTLRAYVAARDATP